MDCLRAAATSVPRVDDPPEWGTAGVEHAANDRAIGLVAAAERDLARRAVSYEGILGPRR